MKVGDLSKKTGLTSHTIRYYERIGLLPRAMRGPSRHREYDASILPWIAFLGRLKTTGMPIRQMLHYAALRAEGPSTEADRKALLLRHRRNVAAHAAELTACLSALDAKIAGYADHETMGHHHEHDGRRGGRPFHAGPARPR